MVEARDVIERPLDPGRDLVDPRRTRLGVGGHVVSAGFEARLEELHEQTGDVGVAAQRLLEIVDREGAVALLHVLGVGPKDCGLPPGEAGSQDQGVEAVDLVVAVPDRADRVLEGLAPAVR